MGPQKEQPKKKITKIEAAEQSHRQQTPSVLVENKEIIAQFDSYDTVLVAYEESAKQGEKVN